MEKESEIQTLGDAWRVFKDCGLAQPSVASQTDYEDACALLKLKTRADQAEEERDRLAAKLDQLEGIKELTLDDVRTNMMVKADKGVDCPCCGRLVKLYRRKLHAEMAVFLIKLVKAYREDTRYYSTREFYPGAVKASTDGSYLVYWELVKKKQGANVAGGKAGQYKPTPIGIEFAMHRCTVLSHIRMLCGEHIGFGGKHVDIIDCLGKKFNYGELMRGN